ncbi:MAG: hypothetical protein AABO57_21090 [Acidobacteriota bacterium]
MRERQVWLEVRMMVQRAAFNCAPTRPFPMAWGENHIRRASVIGLLLLIALLSGMSSAMSRKDSGDQSQQTLALTQLPFCALVLRSYKVSDSSDHVYVLMAPAQVTEENLRELFQSLSDAYSKSTLLQVSVYTDVRQLDFLATGLAQSGPDDPVRAKPKSPSRAADSTDKERNKPDEYQWAYYVRWKDGEFFRFNPDFPKKGTKTVTLRGKQ